MKITDFIESGKFIFEIGGVSFSKLPDGTFWLENADGEGTQVNSDVLEEKINDLFDQIM